MRVVVLELVIDGINRIFNTEYNLGSPDLKPYKRETKTHQNDMVFIEK